MTPFSRSTPVKFRDLLLLFILFFNIKIELIRIIQAPQTPTSQGPGQVVYHSGHPNQPGPNQISMPPGAPGAIIHYQLSK